MAIQVSPLEVLVLKKLTIINHALAKQLPGTAGIEQKALVQVLNEITLRADTDNAKKFVPEGLPMSVVDWLQERMDNCHRIAAQKKGADRESWLQDSRYFAEAVNALTSGERTDG